MVYVIEFSEPLGDTTQTYGSARYYVGCCRDGRLDDRLDEHRRGQGAFITAAAAERGITMQVVATFRGGFDLEKRIKRQKNTPRIIQRIQAGKPPKFLAPHLIAA